MGKKKRAQKTGGNEQESGDSSSQKDQPKDTVPPVGGSGDRQQQQRPQPLGQQQQQPAGSQPPGQQQLPAAVQPGGKKQPQQQGQKKQPQQQQGQQQQHPQPLGQQQQQPGGNQPPGQQQLAAGVQPGGKKQQQQSQKKQPQQQQQGQQQQGQKKQPQQQQGQQQQHPQPLGQPQQQQHAQPVGKQQQLRWGNQPPVQQQQQYPQMGQQQQQPWGNQPPGQQRQQGQQQQQYPQMGQQQQQYPQMGQQQQQPWGNQPPGQQRQQGQQQQQYPKKGQQQQQPWGNQPAGQQQQSQKKQSQQQQGQQMKHPGQQQPQPSITPTLQQLQIGGKQPPGQPQVVQLPIQQQGGQGKEVEDQKKQLQQPAHGSAPIPSSGPQKGTPSGQRAQTPQRKAAADETLPAGVSQAVRNVHEGLSKSSTPEHQAKVKTSLPTSLSLELLQKVPRRRNPNICGTQGRPITVLTNMMSLVMNGNFQNDAVHYDVTITPDKPKYMMRPVMEAFRQIHYPQRFPAFDGKKNLYSATILPFGSHIKGTVTIMNEERQREQTFEVSMNKVREVDLSVFKSGDKLQLANPSNLEALQVIDTVLRHGPSLHFTTVGRSFFQPPRQQTSLSDGMDLWVGTYQSVVLGWKPYLNVDVAHKGFPTSQNVISLMHELSRQRTYGRDTQQQQVTAEQVNYKRSEIHDYIKGLKVHYEIPGMPLSKRTVRVNGLVKAANEEIFALDDGNKCTVEQYFRIQKKYKLQYPDYPCLWIGPRDKTIYVPPELCTIMAGQATMKKLNPEQTRNMIRAAATNTEIRKQKIMDAFTNLRINDSAAARNEFGVSVQGKFEVVPARVLNPPKVHYNDRDMFVQKGVWNVGKFVEPMTMGENEWTILNMDQRLSDSRLYAFEEELRRQATNVGMSIGKAEKPFKVVRPPTRDIREITAYFQEKKKKRLKLVIVIIPEFGDVYSKVKQITELNVGLVTQCIKRKTMDRLSDATVVNILLKINSKLNGVNHTLAKTTRPKCLATQCMIIGADVTHPSPDAIQTPSIAAVTSSFDPEAFQYHIEIRLQPPKVEVILDMEKITALQLHVFKKHRGYFPENIIVYRDGVSEGQIPQVIHHELSAIKRGCNSVLKKYIPVTFFVVQKRHHIRLFPTDMRNSDDARKNMNVQAGTIVDTHITHPTHIDFYLVSHASIQGTARPTKYKCIWNDLQMTEDDIEELTYYLCHLFARCTRSVSYPAPTYYAHLAAFRARALTQNVPIRMDRLEEEQRTKLTLQVNQDAPMFFV